MQKNIWTNSHIKKYAYYDIEDIYNNFSISAAGLSPSEFESMKDKCGIAYL